MDTPRFSVSTPICQCPRCGWPVEDRAEPGEIINLPVIVRYGAIRRMAEDVARRRRNVTAHEIMTVRFGGWRISHARFEVMWMARQLKDAHGNHRFSFPQIGRAFCVAEGGLDHTSAIHGFRQHEKAVREELKSSIAASNAASARIHGVAA